MTYPLHFDLTIEKIIMTMVIIVVPVIKCMTISIPTDLCSLVFVFLFTFFLSFCLSSCLYLFIYSFIYLIFIYVFIYLFIGKTYMNSNFNVFSLLANVHE